MKKIIKNRIQKEKEMAYEFIRLLKFSVNLLLYNIWVLVPFLFIYVFLTENIIKPLVSVILSFVLSITGIEYIGYDNILTALLNPIFDITVILSVLILAFFCLFEIVGIVYLVNESYYKRKVSFFGLIVQSAKKSFEIIFPKNWLAIIYVLILMPLTSTGVGDTFISSISVPHFIEEYILEVPWMLFLYAAILIILVLFVYFTFFSFDFFVLGNLSFNQSVIESLKLMKSKLFRFRRMQFYWAIFVVLLRIISIGILMIVIIMIGGFVVYQALEANHISVLMSGVIGFLSVTQLLLITLNTLFTVSMTTTFVSAYYIYNVEVSSESNSLIVNNIRIPFFKRTLVTLTSLIFIIAIVAHAGAAYILVNYRSYINTIKGPAITAHRGASSLAPENSRSSIEKAIELGADYVEFDLTQTKDGVLVVSHDNDLSKRFGINKIISQSTLEELKDVDIGTHFSPEFASERIITFEDAIQICKGRIKMNIELKPTADDHDMVETAVKIFQDNNLYEDGFFASVDLETLFKVEELDSKINTCYNTSIAFGEIQYLPIDFFSIEQSFITGSLIDTIHDNSKQIFAWTVDNEDEIKTLTEEGINNIVTNDIAMARKTIDDVVKVYNSNKKNYAFRYLMNTFFDINITEFEVEE